jgi:alkanesulfonate monooxygenase SsuD/methylene tetrahydromethanopterin reductase-like flavin-dependent oxidoreductase (luciferase family)
MRFDVQHPVADPAWSPSILRPDALRRFARAVEECGYGGIGFTDHPAPSEKWVRGGGEGSIDPFSALGFCAAVTSSVRLVTWVLVLPYRNPFLTAHQAASLDVLSDGRLTLGLGTGYLRAEFLALGADLDRRLATFVHPQQVPVQRPAPPLWVHGNSRWGRERAARYGDGWVGVLTGDPLAGVIRTAPMAGLDALRRNVDELRTLTSDAGRDPSAVEAVLAGNWPMLDVRKGWDADRLLADVDALREIGVDRVFLTICGDDAGAAEDTVRRFAEEIVAVSQEGSR